LVVLCFFLFQIGFTNLENEDFAKDIVDTTQANLRLQVPIFLKKIQKLKKEGSTIQFDRSAEFIKGTSNKRLIEQGPDQVALLFI